MATRDVAQRFIEALHRLEGQGDVEPLVEIFSDDCTLSNAASHHLFRGRDDVRRFWREYRGSFSEIRSNFRNRIESEGRVALEWRAEGTSPDGSTFAYDGVSILEFDGDRVKRFHAYFDPRHLGHQLYGRHA
ncbi:nuclear transport factor 2 family protein [Vulgatibacter sp.]|uniref:nuclear transport factor 2 family protein n=1 Tax=Vulgatibacter sp. TaxID=1971226 RepID=UPI003561D7AB